MSNSLAMDAPARGDRMPLRGRLRLWVRRGCFAAAVFVLLFGVGKWPVAWIVAAASPWIAAATLLATWSVTAASSFGLAILVLTLLRRRWFCRWMCPTGLCADTASLLGTRLRRRCPAMPRWGMWLAGLGLAGAALGYPLLLWLDPLAMFSATFAAWGPAAQLTTAIAALGLPGVLLISLLWPTLWCARLCPLGGFQEIVAWPAAGVQRLLRRRENPPVEEAKTGDGWRIARRTALAAAAGLVGLIAARTARPASPPALRPPGALDEPQFLGVCIRCGNCGRACPAKIIHPDAGRHGLAGWLAPLVRFDDDYCREGCVRCTQVCPSGALQPIAKKKKIAAVIGFPVVDMDVCLLGEARECSLCRSHCPFEAIRYEFCEIEYTLVPRIDPARCPGCGACEVACPTAPKAIVVRPLWRDLTRCDNGAQAGRR